MISVVVVLAVTCLVVSSMLMLYKSMWGSPKEKYTNQKQKKKQKQIQLEIAKKQLLKKLAMQTTPPMQTTLPIQPMLPALPKMPMDMSLPPLPPPMQPQSVQPQPMQPIQMSQDELIRYALLDVPRKNSDIYKMTFKDFKEIFKFIMQRDNSEQELIKYVSILPVDIRSAFLYYVIEDYVSTYGGEPGGKLKELLPLNVRQEINTFRDNHHNKIKHIVIYSRPIHQTNLKYLINNAQSLSTSELIKRIREMSLSHVVQLLINIPDRVDEIFMSLPFIEYAELRSVFEPLAKANKEFVTPIKF